MKNRTRRTRRTRRNIRKRVTQKRIKGAGLYESNPEQLYKMLKSFITKQKISTENDMIDAVTEYKTKKDYIDDKDYLALRNYIWSQEPDEIHMFVKIEKRPFSTATPDGVCREIAEYFFQVKQKAEDKHDSEMWDSLVKQRQEERLKATYK
jgi:hypothetical protein